MRYGGKCHLPDRKKMALSSVEATKEGQKQTGWGKREKMEDVLGRNAERSFKDNFII